MRRTLFQTLGRMINFKCSNCSFSFTEADKAWDEAIKNARCPKCKIFNPELDIEHKFKINTPKFPQEEIRLNKNIFYIRLIISILCWASSYVAIFISAHFVADIFLLKKHQDIFTVLIFFYPWLALLVMNIGWIKNYRVNLFWPYSGTIFALLAVLISIGSALLIAPLCILLAIWLVIFHLRFDSLNNE